MQQNNLIIDFIIVNVKIKILTILIILIMIFSFVFVSNPDNAFIGHKVGVFPANPINVNSGKKVNPYVAYSKEPAPMGIGDFGIGPNNTTYLMNTTSFTGIVNITAFKTYNSSLSSSEKREASIQLNLHLNFTYAGKTYVYWIQNVAVLNTAHSTPSISILDNVWNQSNSRSPTIYPNSITGNGSVSKYNGVGFYEYQLNSVLNSKYIALRETSAMVNGYPHVYMYYNSGNGWAKYDNINFTFAHNSVKDRNFVVQGKHYNPQHNICDAELILGGPGNGASTRAISSNLTMQLQYWNGHNYQAVLNAYDFGSSTKETISNLNVTPDTSFPGAHIVNGSGRLYQLYNKNNLSFYNLTADYIISGYAIVNNERYSFKNDKINLALLPGTYNVSLYSSYNQLIYSTSFSVKKGSTNSSSITPIYPAIFNENGLFKDTFWEITINNLTLSTYSNKIIFYEYNGTYNYRVSGEFGYSIKNQTGSFNETGKTVLINIGFHGNPLLLNFEKYYFYYLIFFVILGTALIPFSYKPKKRGPNANNLPEDEPKDPGNSDNSNNKL